MATNHEVGSSNLSGRANTKARGNAVGPFSLALSRFSRFGFYRNDGPSQALGVRAAQSDIESL
jgi:hypothetical protein